MKHLGDLAVLKPEARNLRKAFGCNTLPVELQITFEFLKFGAVSALT